MDIIGYRFFAEALSDSTFWIPYLPLDTPYRFDNHCAAHSNQSEQGGMSSYISRVFARPHPTHDSTPPRPTNDREPELNHPSPYEPAPTTTPPDMTNQSSASAPATRSIPIDKHSEDQFQLMLSSILTQNSNLLAQNTEQARVIDRLSICLSEAEAGQKELREEMRGMFRGIMDILGGLKSTPAAPVGGAGTPVSAVADVVPITTQVRDEFRDLIAQDQDQGNGFSNEEGTSREGYWSAEKGKQNADEQGVDPNVFQRRTFTSLDTPNDRGDGQEMDMDLWSETGEREDDPLNIEIRRNRRQS